jgi:hypothetical protein
LPIWHAGFTGNSPNWLDEPLTSDVAGNPNPTANRVMISPGRAGVNRKPGADRDSGPSKV